MIPFKGRNNLKIYLPKKPVKWGFKLWCLAGVSGYVYEFQVSGDQKAHGPPEGVKNGEEFGKVENVVLRLTRDFQPGKHYAFFDNLFASPDLMMELKTQGIFAIGTLRANRTRGRDFSKENEMKKLGRGSSEEYTDEKNGVVISLWYDNRLVLMVSNFLGVEPQDEANRFSKKENEMIKLPRPASVAMYNKFMGGVDKADMFLSLYRSKMRSKKWYHRIAFHLLQLTAVNSYSLYKEIGGNGSYLDFLVDICRSLVAAEDVDRVDREDLPKIEINNRSLKARDVPKSIRYDRIDHWPLQLTKAHCKYPGCNRRTAFKCLKCSVFLCVNGSDCFLQYHGVL